MALLTATISGSLVEPLGVVSSYATVRLTVSSTNGTLSDGPDVRIGDIVRVVGEDGSLTITDVPCLPQEGYGDYRWNLHVTYSGTQPDLELLGLAVEGDTTWGELVDAVTLGVNPPSSALEEVAAYRDEAEAARDASAASAASINREQPGGVAGLDSGGYLLYSRLPDLAKTGNGGKPVGKGELIFNVQDYGALGDGITNDGTAILAAGAAATAATALAPAVVWFPWSPKGYICNSTISLGNGITYRGDRRVRIRHTAPVTTHFNSPGAQNWTVENLTLDDSAGWNTVSPVRCAIGTRRYTVRNCRFVGGTKGKSNPIVNKQVASNVATLTTADPHGMEVGSLAHISGMPSLSTLPAWDGDYTVTSVPTSTTFTFAFTAADSASVAVNGAWLNGETYRSITHKAVTSNVATFTTSVPHGYSLGQYVWITGVEGENDGGGNGVLSSGQVRVIGIEGTNLAGDESNKGTTIPGATHFSTAPTQTGTHANIATTALTPNGTTGFNSQAQPNGTRQAGIDHQTGCSNGLVEYCWFDGCATAIRIPDVKGIIFQHNLVTNWSDRCIYLISQDTVSDEDVWILNNRLLDYHQGGSPRQPIACQASNTAFPHERLRIEGNVAIGPNKSWTARDPGTADQISVQCANRYRLAHNYSAYGGDLGMHAGGAGGGRGVITGNILMHNDTAGVNLGSQTSAAGSDYIVSNNLLMNNGQNRSGDRPRSTAISIAGNISNVTYSGNHIRDDQVTPTQTMGFYFRDASNVYMYGNTINALTPYSTDEGCTNINYQVGGGGRVSVLDYGAVGDGVADDQAAFTAANTQAGATGQITVPKGTYKIGSNLTLTCQVVLQAGALVSPSTGVTVTMSERVTGPPFTTCFGPNGTVLTGKPQTVDADWWGPKGTSSAQYQGTIQRALDSTAQGTKIQLAGKYWSSMITVDANEDTKVGDQSKSLVGVSAPGVRTNTATTEWGAEIWLGGSLFTDLFYANGTVTATGQPSRFGFFLDNIKFNGSRGTNNGGGSCVRLANVKDFYIGRILCEQAGDRGFYVSAASNQVIGNHIEAMNNNNHGIDLAALGDSHFNFLLSGSHTAAGSHGVQIGGGTQVNQIHSYLNANAGVSFTGDKNAVSMVRVNDNALTGVLFTGATETWVGNCLTVDNGTSTAGSGSDPLRCGVRFTGASSRNKIEHVNAANSAGVTVQKYGVRYDTPTLTGNNNLVGSFVGVGNQIADVSQASGTNYVDKINGVSTYVPPAVTPPQLDSYTTAGTFTWTKPTGAVRVEVVAISPGAGGGSGRRGAAASVRTGGAGGAGGLRAIATFKASDLGATENVTVGAAGVGGPATTADSTNGTDGGQAGLTFFGISNNRWLAPNVAGGGSAGNTTTTTGGSAAGPGGSVGAAASSTGLVGTTSNNATGRGTNTTGGAGAAGGGLTTADATSAGGTGAIANNGSNSAAVGGTAGGGVGADGNAARANTYMAAGGAAGGGSSTTTAAGKGGTGGFPGGGGGGGGASANGFNSGAGGDGGGGAIYVTTYFS